MSILNLLTAIYWGQLSKCTSFDQDLKQYACSLSQPDAYGAVCAFAVLLFLTQIVFTYMLYIWRGALIDDVDVIYNDSYSSLPQTGAPTSNNYGNKFAPVQTAEL